MDHQARSLTCVLVSAMLALGAWADEAGDYATWMAGHAQKALSRGGGRSTLALRLTITEFREPDPERQNAISRIFDEEASLGIELTEDGHLWSFHRDSFADRGGGGGAPLRPATLARIEELLATLPEDGGRLPPPLRRVLIRAKVGERSITRLYDRAQAPDAAWELMRICRCPIALLVPDFKPQSTIDTQSGFISSGFLRLTPDGQQLLFIGDNRSLQFWHPVSHELLNELRGLGTWGIAFSPDGKHAVMGTNSGSAVLDTQTWARTPQKFNCGQAYFTQDGHHLVQDGRDGRFNSPLKIYDTATWQPVVQLPEIPADALCFRPAAKRALAIVQTKAGAVSLWDTEAHREIAVLRPESAVAEVAFSADEALVAVSTRPRDSGFYASYGIWRTADGTKVHELHPFERGELDRSSGLIWTPDGAYLLAGVSDIGGSRSSVCLFNATTGRQEAEFSGSMRINGLVLLPDATQLVAGDSKGEIHFWDFQEALRKTREFQRTLQAR